MKRNEVNETRRHFLKIGVLAGAGMVVTAYSPPFASKDEAMAATEVQEKDRFAPNAWIRIDSDDVVTVMVNHSEMGQGITTALPMIVAEELEADWGKVRFKMAPVADVYKHPDYGIQWTVSSKSVESSWDLLREAGARVRQLFILAAADTWQVPVGELRAEKSRVIHGATGKRLRYGELIQKASRMAVPESVRLKHSAQYKIIGKPIRRLDSPIKAKGRAKFGVDVKLPNMLMATVVHPPVFGSEVQSMDDGPLRGMKGVRGVFPSRPGWPSWRRPFGRPSRQRMRLRFNGRITKTGRSIPTDCLPDGLKWENRMGNPFSNGGMWTKSSRPGAAFWRGHTIFRIRPTPPRSP